MTYLACAARVVAAAGVAAADQSAALAAVQVSPQLYALTGQWLTALPVADQAGFEHLVQAAIIYWQLRQPR